MVRSKLHITFQVYVAVELNGLGKVRRFKSSLFSHLYEMPYDDLKNTVVDDGTIKL